MVDEQGSTPAGVDVATIARMLGERDIMIQQYKDENARLRQELDVIRPRPTPAAKSAP